MTDDWKNSTSAPKITSGLGGNMAVQQPSLAELLAELVVARRERDEARAKLASEDAAYREIIEAAHQSLNPVIDDDGTLEDRIDRVVAEVAGLRERAEQAEATAAMRAGQLKAARRYGEETQRKANTFRDECDRLLGFLTSVSTAWTADRVRADTAEADRDLWKAESLRTAHNYEQQFYGRIAAEDARDVALAALQAVRDELTDWDMAREKDGFPSMVPVHWAADQIRALLPELTTPKTED